MIKIAIADDHKLFRQSLASLINHFQGMQTVLEAENGLELLELLPTNPVDLILLDIQMPKMGGFETCSRLRIQFPDIKVLIISMLNSKETIHNVMRYGAHGFFSKNVPPEELEQAILNINNSRFVLEKEISDAINKAFFSYSKTQGPFNEQLPFITPRELQIALLVCRQFTSKQIADHLCISVPTVETHRQNLITKTNAINIIGAVLFLIQHGLLPINPNQQPTTNNNN